MSNNFCKLGYFKVIHSICYKFFRLLETYSPFQININNKSYFIFLNKRNSKISNFNNK